MSVNQYTFNKITSEGKWINFKELDRPFVPDLNHDVILINNLDSEDIRIFNPNKIFQSKYRQNEAYITNEHTNKNDNLDVEIVYRKEVFNALKSIYENTENWESDTGRGPSGRGGVINIYTISEILKQHNLLGENEEVESGDWSILNYFDTYPKIRELIISKFESKNGKIKSEQSLDKFRLWIQRHKEKLFGDTPNSMLPLLIEMNSNSYVSGYKNEKVAYDFIKSKINQNKWEMGKLHPPGSPIDRSGIDFSIVNKQTGEVLDFQAKPLGNYQKTENETTVKSYKVINLKKLPVDYYVFAAHGKEEVLTFKKDVNKMCIVNKNMVSFKCRPLDVFEFSF